ncbi:carbon-nitrogen hydrolase family protein [Acidobacteriota bacterium]
MNNLNRSLKRASLLTLLFTLFQMTFLFAWLEVPSADTDRVTIACVNYHTIWGEKRRNLEKIMGYVTDAAKRGADIILFPELALTGYAIGDRPMHKDNAEAIPGPSTEAIAELAHKYNVYVIFGLVEKTPDIPNALYNSAAVIGPEGVIGAYRKLMPFGDEMIWCQKGKEPFAFNTPWGLVGVSICYDSYMFPELARYYAALGARIYLNVTAIGPFYGWKPYYLNQLKARAIENMMFVASANLVGRDLRTDYEGGSLVVGPSEKEHEVLEYSGPASSDKEEVISVTVDLGASDRMRKRYPLFWENPFSKSPDWRLNLYQKMLRTIKEKTDLGKYE